MDGRVIGIVSHIHSRSGGFEGLGFAVASNVAKWALLERRALWTGIEGSLLTGSPTALLNVPQREACSCSALRAVRRPTAWACGRGACRR